MNKKELAKNIISAAAAILLWELVSLAVGNNLLLASPVSVIKRLFELCSEADFFTTVFFSLLRIAGGFAAAFLLGSLCALAAGRFPLAETLLKPYVACIKAVPVASFIILCLIWFSFELLTVFIAFLIAFPVIYSNILRGIKSIPENMRELALCYDIKGFRKFRYIIMPSLRPFTLSACSVGAGMAWKAGIAAEVIGVTDGSIGEKLYEAKIYFSNPDLLAWTLVIVILSVVLEKIICALIAAVFNFNSRFCPDIHNKKTAPPPKPGEIVFNSVNKSFGEKSVLCDFNCRIKPGETLFVTGVSGGGKTTLARLIAGLAQPDGGSIEGTGQSVSFMFQEDRLFEDFSAVSNIRAVTGNIMTNAELCAVLTELGLGDSLAKPVKNLSGGMRRRVSLIRALCRPSQILLLDEPYKGLDAAAKQSAEKAVEKLSGGRTVIIITHDFSDIKGRRFITAPGEITAG